MRNPSPPFNIFVPTYYAAGFVSAVGSGDRTMFNQIQDAIDSDLLFITLLPGQYDDPIIVDTTGCTIVGMGRNSCNITNRNGTGSVAISVTASHVTLKDLGAFTDAGGAGGGKNVIGISGARCSCLDLNVSDSDAIGIAVVLGSGADHTRIRGCTVGSGTIDGVGIDFEEDFCSANDNWVGETTGFGMQMHVCNDSQMNNNIILANSSMQITASATNCLADGNTVDTAATNSSGSSQVTDEEVF